MQGTEGAEPPSREHDEACGTAAATVCEGPGYFGNLGEGFDERGADGAGQPEHALMERAEAQPGQGEGQDDPQGEGEHQK